MATLFRIIVMLIVLVGLPAAWVYYGPLPPAAMGVIQRTVATAKNSLGWPEPLPSESWRGETPMSAPRFDSSLAESTATRQPQAVTRQALPPIPLMRKDAQFTLASASVSAAAPASSASRPPSEPPVAAAPPMQVDSELARQLEPHLSLLRKLNAAEYTLENWGGGGRLYRFRCAIALGESEDHTRQFEAIHADPLHAVHQVVGEVTSWQNARRLSGASRWQ